MKSTFQSEHFTEREIVKTYANGFRTQKLIEEHMEYKNSDVELDLKEIFLNGLHINIRHEKIKPPFVMQVEHDFPFLKMHFEIKGSSQYIPNNDQSLPVSIPSGHYNFFFLPKVKGTLTYNRPIRKTLEINFTKGYLKRVFGHSFMEASSTFGEALKNDEPFLMWEQSKPITPRLHMIIQEIMDCTFDGPIKKIYMESKVMEILTILFNDLKHKKDFEKTLVDEDYTKILEAGSMLRNNLRNPPTIPELSIITGINQFKLKQHFKLVFRKPIFTFITDLRMERAKQLIVDKGYTITETAYEVGYKNPQHFTAAFKRKYNYLPSSLKNN